MGNVLYKELQKLKDLSQKSQDEIAMKSGIPKSTVAKILAGVTKSPSLEAVKSIVYAMGFTLADLDDIQKGEKRAAFDASAENFTKKYRTLDEHGREIVDAVLDIEYKRVQSHTILVAARGGGVQHIYDENADTLEHDISQIPQTDEEF